MWFPRTPLGDPRLHLGAIVIMAVVGMALFFGSASTAQCPECPGHRVSIRDCLCSHTPALIGTTRR